MDSNQRPPGYEFESESVYLSPPGHSVLGDLAVAGSKEPYDQRIVNPIIRRPVRMSNANAGRNRVVATSGTAVSSSLTCIIRP